MRRRIAFFSRGQLTLLALFLANSKRAMGVAEITGNIKYKGESLGGLISSLVRTKYRGQALIEPWGRDEKGVGMRWRINEKAINLQAAKQEVNRLLAGYTA